jgi:hypothetical protein
MKSAESILVLLKKNKPIALAEPDIIKRIDDSIESHDVIIARRVELHKELGSFIDPDNKPAEPIPMITPLSKLSVKEQNALYKNIFDQATFNIETVMGIAVSDLEFETQVSNEADRLLNVWIEMQKS